MTAHVSKNVDWPLSKSWKTMSSQRINHLGATRIAVWAIKHLVSPLQRWIYRSSGGKALSNLGSDRPVLLLTTKGRQTGKDRTIPVFYLRHDEAIVICNVRPKSERTNPWVLNLQDHSVAWLQIGGDIAQYQARQATGSEIKHFWPLLVELWPAFKAHHDNGGRRSIFILERA
jgi:deazaflavin-dependent oxidoreductase (nitroreductase family)